MKSRFHPERSRAVPAKPIALRTSWALLLAFCFAGFMQAQMQMNIDQLVQFVRSEVALKQATDKQVAAYVRTVQLTEKLTDKTILDLEAQGAGPKTVQALQQLRDKTAAMRPPTHDVTSSPATAPDSILTSAPATAQLTPKTPPIPPPSSVRQSEILDAMKQYALSYTQNLPNFICVEVMRRYIDPNAGDHFRSLGSVLSKVSYNGGQEKYQVFSVNGHYQETTLEKAAAAGGSVSSGEFGSLMREIFEPHSEAEFGWERWARLRGRRAAVFNYFVDSGHSSWSITYTAGPGDEQRIVTAYKGLIYADENTGEIERIQFVAVDIPKTFPVSEATEILDYDLVNISGESYVCPLMARLLMTAGREKTKNEIEFRDYRKFGTKSTVTYGADAPPPMPESETEEQPITSASSGTEGPAANVPAAAKPSTAKAAPTASPWTLPSAPQPPPQ